jgi:hypothetical protein
MKRQPKKIPPLPHVACSFCGYYSAGVIYERGLPAQKAWCRQCWLARDKDAA